MKGFARSWKSAIRNGRNDRTDPMTHDFYPDNTIRQILRDTRTIAMIGASPNTVRPSYFVFKYLTERGYDVIPVNPGQAGKPILGKTFVGALRDITQPIDMVDV